jgi:hypothetical protein
VLICGYFDCQVRFTSWLDILLAWRCAHIQHMLQVKLGCKCLTSFGLSLSWTRWRKSGGSSVWVEPSFVNVAVVGFLQMFNCWQSELPSRTLSVELKTNYYPRTTLLFQPPPPFLVLDFFRFFSYSQLLFHVIKGIQVANANDVPRTNWNERTRPVRLRLNSVYTLLTTD